ncbi:MAG: Asp-tRNA(Asn)/Glu-tRNA(Gln) amidotransferase subunit GatB [Oscillospiraceae bacterium]
MQYETVVGLEIHAELSTESKLFCGCKNAFGAPPNTLCCPVCTGMPGALPTLNAKAVDYAVKMGLALGCTINTRSKMDRKQYFYPDLPKGYQISQYDVPLCENGGVEVFVDGRVRRFGIERIHMEEDAGKLMHHTESGGTLVDFNRCGVPLIEIVTAPDMRSAAEARAVMEAIAQILLYLGISDAKMQEGSLRADVNVSVRPQGQSALGVRTEMKNVNSFSAVQRAVLCEAQRQRALLEQGLPVQQETRRWDDTKGQSFLLRSKETAQDYRYFPEPDLLPFCVSEESVQSLRAELPELPLARTRRIMNTYSLSPYAAGQICAQKDRADFFEAAAGHGTSAKSVANWLLGDVQRLLNERHMALRESQLTPESLAGMLTLIETGALSGTAAKEVLEAMLETGLGPEQVARQQGLVQVSDAGALAELVETVLRQHPKAVADYRAGKRSALGFLVGQGMKAGGGAANPQLLKQLMESALNTG